ncbi:MAG: hypothetical protein WCK89_03960 [bacterium]
MNMDILPLLEDVEHARVDEVIWGHRIREDQTAWLLVLEMFNVAQACLESEAKDPLADVGKANAPLARPCLRIRFRNLLFRLNQKAAELAARVQAKNVSSEMAWKEWLAHTKDEYEGPGAADYSPLQNRFHDFVQFERGVDLVRSTAVNGLDGSKGIYNRFIFPMAAEALYWEVGVRADGGEKRLDHTANTFTRAGTLLHIMLARSKAADSLRASFTIFLDRDSQARRLLRMLQIDEIEDTRKGVKTYLPYASHRRFDLLGEDYVSVLTLQAPDNDKLTWLVPLSALHISLYHAEVASERFLGGKAPLPMICEIVAPRRTVVRQLSVESLTENSDLARRAVDMFLSNTFSSEEWGGLVGASELPLSERLEKACEFLRATFRVPDRILEEHVGRGQVEVLRDEVTKYFRDRHAKEFSRVHFTYGREAGLVSKRATNRYRYAPTDQLLQSLVLANVVHECPLEQFLDRLFTRYGIIIGPRQQTVLEEAKYRELAETVSGQAFRRNQRRFEARLKSMGMLRRLSDSQAYVLNPLQPREQSR